MAYRARQGIDPADGAASPSWCRRWSTPTRPGVLFTANPANGRRDEIVIGAAWGLGEAVVSGAVDHGRPRRGQGTGAVINPGGRPTSR